MKKTIGIAAILIFVLAMSAVAFAGTLMTPAEVYSEVSGKTIEEAYAARGDKTFGELAADEGLLESFQSLNLENRKLVLQERVENGQMTQEQADLILDQMENCDGTPGGTRLGMNLGAAFGRGNAEKGSGYGNGMRNGGNGGGFGQQLRDGSGLGTPKGNGFNK